MPTAQDIASQQERLDQYRENVRTLLQQIAAQGGFAYALPSTLNTLAEARKEIAARKAILRGWGVEVADHPDDEASTEPAALRPGQVLHQLRAPVSDFVGRDEVVANLVAALRTAPGGRVAAICGLRGMGGIGKTELAYAAAARLRIDYPDAQILLGLRGASDKPLSPEQTLQHVINAFRPELKLPKKLPALQALYRNVLAGKRVLIVADDAENATQVRPLMPPVGCALLITSRQCFMLDGMSTFDLKQFSEDAAFQLLNQICKRLTETYARQIGRLCGYHPLALRVSASVLANNPSLSAEHYLSLLADKCQRLEQLRDPDDPERDVAATLHLSYAILDIPTQNVFRQLGVLVADADQTIIAAVLEQSEEQIEMILRPLVRHNLVEYNNVRKLWSMHDLVRVLALHLLTSAREEYAVQLRYAEALHEKGESAFKESKNASEARFYYEQSLLIKESILGKDNQSVAITLYELGNVAQFESRFYLAYQYYRRAQAIESTVLGPNHYLTRMTRIISWALVGLWLNQVLLVVGLAWQVSPLSARLFVVILALIVGVGSWFWIYPAKVIAGVSRVMLAGLLITQLLAITRLVTGYPGLSLIILIIGLLFSIFWHQFQRRTPIRNILNWIDNGVNHILKWIFHIIKRRISASEQAD